MKGIKLGRPVSLFKNNAGVFVLAQSRVLSHMCRTQLDDNNRMEPEAGKYSQQVTDIHRYDPAPETERKLKRE